MWTDCGQQQWFNRKWHYDCRWRERSWRSWHRAIVTRKMASSELLYRMFWSTIGAQSQFTQCLWRWWQWTQYATLTHTTATSNLMLDTTLLPSKQCGTFLNREPQRQGQWSTTHKLRIHFALPFLITFHGNYCTGGDGEKLLLSLWDILHNGLCRVLNREIFLHLKIKTNDSKKDIF